MRDQIKNTSTLAFVLYQLRNRIGMKKTERKMPVSPLMEIWNGIVYVDENDELHGYSEMLFKNSSIQ